MKEITILNENNYEETIKQEIVLIKFGATWCGPCRVMEPVIENLNETFKDNENIIISTVDIDKEPMLPSLYGVRAVPTIIILKKGEIKNTIVGVKTKEELEKLIRNLI